jgi:hypothetical protein
MKTKNGRKFADITEGEYSRAYFCCLGTYKRAYRRRVTALSEENQMCL